MLLKCRTLCKTFINVGFDNKCNILQLTHIDGKLIHFGGNLIFLILCLLSNLDLLTILILGAMNNIFYMITVFDLISGLFAYVILCQKIALISFFFSFLF